MITGFSGINKRRNAFKKRRKYERESRNETINVKNYCNSVILKNNFHLNSIANSIRRDVL